MSVSRRSFLVKGLGAGVAALAAPTAVQAFGRRRSSGCEVYCPPCPPIPTGCDCIRNYGDEALSVFIVSGALGCQHYCLPPKSKVCFPVALDGQRAVATVFKTNNAFVETFDFAPLADACEKNNCLYVTGQAVAAVKEQSRRGTPK